MTRRRLGTIAFAIFVTILVLAGFGPAGGIVAGFVLITPLELAFRRHEQKVRRPGLRTDMTHVLFTNLLGLACIIAAVIAWAIVLLPFSRGPLPDLYASQPEVVRGIEAFLLFEVLGYIAHRLMHEVGFLWRFHAVHHSSEQLDWISGARAHPVEGFVIGTVVAPPLLLLGVQPQALGAFSAFVSLWAVLLHANIRWRFRWMDGWWGTPELHHWHHSNHPEAHNKNFSGFLPIIDRLFGTYYQPKDRRPERYGIDEPMPDTWFGQMVHPFRRRARHGRETGAGIDPTARPSRPAPHAPVLPAVRFVT